MIELNKIYNEDCLEGMKRIPDGSVDLVLTDPPYGTTACKWDSVIPFEPMWEQLNRTIKPNGAICIFGSEPFSSALRMSNIKHFKYDWIWKKDQAAGFVNAKCAPLKTHEVISVFSHGTIANGSKNKMEYFPQGLIEINKTRKVDKKDGTFLGARKNQDGKQYVQKYKNYPQSIIMFSRDRGLHPTQKPVALLEYLIKTYTDEGNTVLDFTMGSGSTGVACINTNRNYIGFELDKHYCDMANERIQKALAEKAVGE